MIFHTLILILNYWQKILLKNIENFNKNISPQPRYARWENLMLQEKIIITLRDRVHEEKFVNHGTLRKHRKEKQ